MVVLTIAFFIKNIDIAFFESTIIFRKVREVYEKNIFNNRCIFINFVIK